MQINFKEYEKQKKDNIIKNGEYCAVDILIGKGDTTPAANIYIQKVTPIEVAALIVTLEYTAKSIAKRNPEAYELSKKLISSAIEIENIL